MSLRGIGWGFLENIYGTNSQAQVNKNSAENWVLNITELFPDLSNLHYRVLILC